MRKSLKKIMASIIATAAIVSTSISIPASASGYVNGSLSGSKVSYTYDADGNYSSATNEGAHYGKSASMCFTITSAGSYLVTFNGAAYSGCKIKIYNYDNNTLVDTISVPLSTSGMPTLYYNVTLPIGRFYVKVVSTTYSSYSDGGFSISNVSGIFYK